MAGFVKGDIVVLPFPFSNLSGSKRRPAFVVKDLPYNDVLLCQITSKAGKDQFSIPLHYTDFSLGGLPVESNVRPNKLFTADKSIIIRKAGTATPEFTNKVINTIIEFISK